MDEWVRQKACDLTSIASAAGHIERPDRIPTLSQDLQCCSRPEPEDAGLLLDEGSIGQAWAPDRLVVGSRRSAAVAVVVAAGEERGLHL